MQNLIVQFGDASVLADFINKILNRVQLIVFSTAFPLVLLNLLGQFSPVSYTHLFTVRSMFRNTSRLMSLTASPRV